MAFYSTPIGEYSPSHIAAVKSLENYIRNIRGDDETANAPIYARQAGNIEQLEFMTLNTLAVVWMFCVNNHGSISGGEPGLGLDVDENFVVSQLKRQLPKDFRITEDGINVNLEHETLKNRMYSTFLGYVRIALPYITSTPINIPSYDKEEDEEEEDSGATRKR